MSASSQGRPLKNFDDYRDVLKRYAKAAGILVRYRKTGPEAVYQPAERIVTLSPNLPESTEIAVFLHELGHAMDEMPDAETWNAYQALYGRTASPSHRRIVLKYERRAWKFGRVLAKRLKIPLGKWFDEEEQESLASYQNWGD